MQAADLHTDLEKLWVRLRAASPTASASGKPPQALQINQEDELDPDQSRAAGHFRGPARVLAPAGSGKTRTLVARTGALVAAGIPPQRILAIAFNTRAAQELSVRLRARDCARVQARTVHALGYAIVREAYGWRYSEGSSRTYRALAAGIAADSLPPSDLPGREDRLVRKALDVFERAKSRLMPYEAIGLPDGDPGQPLAGAFRALVSVQERLGLLTYTDMLYFALRALIDQPELRRRWQQRCEFLLVDEFQDLNPAQFLLLRILALPENNFFAVGDDDQLIYAWRGADDQQILDFERYFPGADTYVLKVNYRSSRRIVRHARWLIENNPERVGKDIRPGPHAPEGRIEIQLRDSLEDQARAVIAWIQALRSSRGLPWGAFGLLSRTNADGRRLADALEGAGLPYTHALADISGEDTSAPEITPHRVTLLTIHRSKGLEFPYAACFNLSPRGESGPAEAAERRVVYVAVTRARDGLLITAGREGYSPFLLEFALNPDLNDFAEPYLARRLGVELRRRALAQRSLRSWFRGWPIAFGLLNRLPSGRADFHFGQPAELFHTELCLRSDLGLRFEA